MVTKKFLKRFNTIVFWGVRSAVCSSFEPKCHRSW